VCGYKYVIVPNNKYLIKNKHAKSKFIDFITQKRPKGELEKGCKINVLHVKTFHGNAFLFLM
jgi:hypothetical protein